MNHRCNWPATSRCLFLKQPQVLLFQARAQETASMSGLLCRTWKEEASIWLAKGVSIGVVAALAQYSQRMCHVNAYTCSANLEEAVSILVRQIGLVRIIMNSMLYVSFRLTDPLYHNWKWMGGLCVPLWCLFIFFWLVSKMNTHDKS